MHILWLGIKWPLEPFLARLLRGLVNNEIQVTVATSHKPDAKWLTEAGIRWLYVPAWRGLTLNAIFHLIFQTLRCWLFAPSDARIFLRNLPDVGWKARLIAWYGLIPFAGRRWDAIYFPWNSAAVHYLPLFELGMPVVLSCRGSQINVAPHNPQRQSLRTGISQTFSQAAAVHCVSEDIQAEAIKLGLELAKARVIRPAVDPDYFYPANRTHNNPKFTLVSTGSLIWRKGYEYALLAIRQLLDQGTDVEYHIIGEGPERQHILFTIDDLELSSRVRLHGKLTPGEVRAWLQRADAFVLSSLSEGISNAVLEAMACGLPVVTTDCGGMREAVTDGVEGYVVPVRDPQAMAKTLSFVWEWHELRKQMGQAARQRIVREFQLDGQVNQWIEIYRSIDESMIG